MSMKHRYVEVTDGTRFRAVLPPFACTIRDAEAEAISDAAYTWGVDPSTIEVFVTRTVTPEKHAALVAAAHKGTLNPDWWLEGRRVEV